MEKSQEQDRQQILDLVADYCRKYHLENKKPYEPGDRIPYASRVYDEKEMVNLVDSALEFWLTAGRYTDEFEEKLAKYLGVRYCSLVNSGSSANLVAFMALTSPLLGGDYRGCRISHHSDAYDSVWGSAGICGCDYSPVQY